MFSLNQFLEHKTQTGEDYYKRKLTLSPFAISSPTAPGRRLFLWDMRQLTEQFHSSALPYGHGAPQDYIRAHMWYNLETALAHNDRASTLEMGRDTIAAACDSIAAKMTSAQIAQAQAMARKCQASNFKQCD